MALVGKRDERNFGYGRQLSYAGPQALKDLVGNGHYSTVKAYSDRQTLLDYAEHLRAQNRLSSVNRTTAALCGDQHVKAVSPSKTLGMRQISVRRSVLQGQDRE